MHSHNAQNAQGGNEQGNQRFQQGNAALLALALGRPAAAQTPAVPQTGSVSNADSRHLTLPTPAVPNHPGGYTDKHLDPTPTPNPLYPNGVPARDLDAGNTRAAQPRSGQAMPGAQPTKSIFKGRKRQ